MCLRQYIVMDENVGALSEGCNHYIGYRQNSAAETYFKFNWGVFGDVVIVVAVWFVTIYEVSTGASLSSTNQRFSHSVNKYSVSIVSVLLQFLWLRNERHYVTAKCALLNFPLHTNTTRTDMTPWICSFLSSSNSFLWFIVLFLLKKRIVAASFTLLSFS